MLTMEISTLHVKVLILINFQRKEETRSLNELALEGKGNIMFITPRGTPCHKMMLVRLKNVGGNLLESRRRIIP